MRSVGENGLALVRHAEGEVLSVYADSRGLPTCGVGHLVRNADNLKLGDTITQAQSDAFLQADLKTAAAAVDSHGLDLTANQRDALIDFAYNAGSGNLARMIDDAGDVPTLADFFSHYTRAGTTHPRGLKIRRALERDLFLAPDGPMPAGWLHAHDDEFNA